MRDVHHRKMSRHTEASKKVREPLVRTCKEHFKKHQQKNKINDHHRCHGMDQRNQYFTEATEIQSLILSFHSIG